MDRICCSLDIGRRVGRNLGPIWPKTNQFGDDKGPYWLGKERYSIEPRLIGPIGTEDFSALSQVHLLKRDEITLKMIIWDLKILTFIDGKRLKAGLLLRGFTVYSMAGQMARFD